MFLWWSDLLSLVSLDGSPTTMSREHALRRSHLLVPTPEHVDWQRSNRLRIAFTRQVVKPNFFLILPLSFGLLQLSRIVRPRTGSTDHRGPTSVGLKCTVSVDLRLSHLQLPLIRQMVKLLSRNHSCCSAIFSVFAPI